jgi:predicted pyridoxine 5'-phosphate oxidase superfamily flavin-nucleotide-binding protein
MKFLSINLRLQENSDPFLHVFQISFMEVISAITGAPSMSKEEVDTFLENKLNLQIGTIDEDGDPNIQPVWFDYDKEREKLLIITPKVARKIKNLRNKPMSIFR